MQDIVKTHFLSKSTNLHFCLFSLLFLLSLRFLRYHWGNVRAPFKVRLLHMHSYAVVFYLLNSKPLLWPQIHFLAANPISLQFHRQKRVDIISTLWPTPIFIIFYTVPCHIVASDPVLCFIQTQFSSLASLHLF